MFKKLIKDTTNWTAKYIKDYNTMVAYYEKQLEEKNKIIDSLEKEIEILQNKSSKTLISDSDILTYNGKFLFLTVGGGGCKPNR